MEVEKALLSQGKLGRWQLKQLLVAGFMSYFPITFASYGTIFQGWVPPHHCRTTNTTHVNDTIPYIKTNGRWELDKCHEYKLPGSDNSTVACRDGYTFQSEGYYTLIEEFSWVCDEAYMISISQSAYFAGLMIGSLFLPPWADYFGRKLPLIVGGILGTMTQFLAVLFVHPIFYMITRFLTGTFLKGAAVCAYVLVTESFPTAHRTMANMLLTSCFVAGALSVGLTGYLVSSWRNVHIVGGVLMSTIFFSIWLLDESIPWLTANSRTNEAIVILKKAAKLNGRKIPESVLKDLQSIAEQELQENTGQEATSSGVTVWIRRVKQVFCKMFSCKTVRRENAIGYMAVFNHPKLRIYTILESFIWCFTSFLYYGLTLNTSVMVGNRFINYTLSSFVELPCVILTYGLMACLGRRIPLIGLYILNAVVLLVATFCPEKAGDVNLIPLLMTFNALGKFCCAGAFFVIYIHTSELYPTNFRNRAVGITSGSARIGSMVAPFMTYLTAIISWLPGVILSCVAIIAALLVLPLPDTKGYSMPQTMEDVDDRKQNVDIELREENLPENSKTEPLLT